MTDICQFCITLTEQCDGLEYALEASQRELKLFHNTVVLEDVLLRKLEVAQKRIAELEAALSLCKPIAEQSKYEAESHDNYYALREANAALRIINALSLPTPPNDRGGE
jgi:hypothetical protein